MSYHYHAEIAYLNADGHGVHSDLCSDTVDDDYREILHEALDEFLKNYDPSKKYPGYFCVGEP